VPVVGGIVVLDERGRWLPIEPSRVGGVDVPVLAARDSAALRILGMLRDTVPDVFARVSQVRRVGPEEIRFTITTPTAGPAGVGANGQAGFILRAGPDLTAARLEDLRPVEGDLARRRVRYTEIDLRFRDQVIARLQ
jgi:cell division protein FtsQ